MYIAYRTPDYEANGAYTVRISKYTTVSVQPRLS